MNEIVKTPTMKKNVTIKERLICRIKIPALFLTALLMLSFTIVSFGQITVTGKVTDASGESIPGVTVIEKETGDGSINGTITDAEGNYSIEVGSGKSVLVFSFLGMKTEELPVSDMTIIDCTLEEEIIGLDEVIVVGYGTQKKSDVTGAVVSIGEDIIESRPSPNIEQMLQGSMAGLSVVHNESDAEGASNSVLIRGQNSISASNTPLVILDGVEYLGELSEINPQDIKSMEILKDASAAAIYGSRGANGVILISTKRGEVGKMITTYNGSFGIDQMVSVPEYFSAKEFYELKTARGETTTPIEDEGYATGRDTDWLSMATRLGKRQLHNLSISGGTERTRYYINTSFTGVQGISVGDKFNRYLFRINLDQKLNKWITYGTSTQFGYYDRSGAQADFEHAHNTNPLGIPYNDDGTYRIQVWEDGGYGKNPMLETLYANSDKARRVISNNYLLFEFPFIKGLSYKLNTGYNFNSGLFQEYRGRNTHKGLQANGELTVENDYDEDWLIENIVSYSREFGRHKLFLTGIYSAQKEWNEGHDIFGNGYPNDIMTYYQAAQGALIEPSSQFSEAQHLSQMFRANYSFNSQYLLTFTVRRDGFSAFGDNSKFGVFPSVAVGWNIAKESFMQNVEQVSVLKLRLSYGVNGNEAVSNYATLPNMSKNYYVSVDKVTLVGFYPNKIGDPTLGWEPTKSFNVGLDFNMFHNRLTGLVDMYQSQTTDLLLDKSISDINGATEITQNIGATQNRGIEMQLTSVNVARRGFTWKTDFNISHHKNKIIHVGLTGEEGEYIDDVDNKWFIGEPIKVYFDYAFGGIWQTDSTGTPQGNVRAGDIRVLDANGDSVISAADRIIQGSRIPKFVAGMMNTFTYKAFKFSFFLYSVVGIEKPNELLKTGDSDLRRNRYPVPYWTPENKSNEYPRSASSSEDVNYLGVNFFRNASFLRIQDVNLSYSLSNRTLTALGIEIQHLEVYANIKNLYTFTEWEGLDPEFNDQLHVPQTRQFLIGLKLSF